MKLNTPLLSVSIIRDDLSQHLLTQLVLAIPKIALLYTNVKNIYLHSVLFLFFWLCCCLSIARTFPPLPSLIELVEAF